MISNIPKPTTVLANPAKPNFEEIWNSNTTTWDTEVRTWLDMGSLFENQAKPTGSGGTIEQGIKFMGHIMQYNESISISGNTINNLPKP